MSDSAFGTLADALGHLAGRLERLPWHLFPVEPFTAADDMDMNHLAVTRFKIKASQLEGRPVYAFLVENPRLPTEATPTHSEAKLTFYQGTLGNRPTVEVLGAFHASHPDADLSFIRTRVDLQVLVKMCFLRAGVVPHRMVNPVNFATIARTLVREWLRRHARDQAAAAAGRGLGHAQHAPRDRARTLPPHPSPAVRRDIHARAQRLAPPFNQAAPRVDVPDGAAARQQHHPPPSPQLLARFRAAAFEEGRLVALTEQLARDAQSVRRRILALRAAQQARPPFVAAGDGAGAGAGAEVEVEAGPEAELGYLEAQHVRLEGRLHAARGRIHAARVEQANLHAQLRPRLNSKRGLRGGSADVEARPAKASRTC